MLEFDEHSGIFTFLGGMIVLVLVAVGFSVLLDKRFKFSSGVNEMRREIEADAADLREITRRHEHLSTEFARAKLTRVDFSKEHTGLTRKLGTLNQQVQSLRGRKADLEIAVGKVGAEFSAYRSKYRTRIWGKAVGEKLGTLTLRGGREYKDSTITKVTDVGLEIRHEHGIARVQAPDLPHAMQDRFQWNDEERRVRLKKEDERLHGKPGDALAAQNPQPPPGEENFQPVATTDKEAERAAERAQLRALREQVRGRKAKVARLSGEKSQAAMNAHYGNAKSVPGSLETWQSRHARLDRDLVKASVELQIAKNRLAEVSPSDPLLKPEPQR